MSYQDDRQIRLKRERSKRAVTLAMQSQWREAVAANKSIIEDFPNDADAYNRLGKAYMELGEYSSAREAYSRAIEIDANNIIAKKNLDRLSRLREAQAGLDSETREVEPQQFIEEAGKAGVVTLYRSAPAEVLARVVAGEKVYLKIDGSNLVVEDAHGQYLGQVEPKRGQRLVKLMQGGNEYTAAIISSTDDTASVIIREVYQHPNQVGQLSFPRKAIEGLPPEISDKIPKPELEVKEESVGEPEVLSKESLEADGNQDNQVNNEE